MNNAVAKPKFSVVLQSDAMKKLINNTLGDSERAKRFIASVTSAVGTDPALQECDYKSIVSGALLGEALNLSPSPQLGQYYLVPYKRKQEDGTYTKEAQFQIGWKGIYQLAVRSGQYKNINVLELKEGEVKSYNPLTEELEVEIITNDIIRDSKPTIGYYASFEFLNGFKKALYWSKQKMLAHADRYSKSFKLSDYEKLQAGQIPQKDMWKYSSAWYTLTDEMGKKTILKQLISKFGIMSIEMQESIVKDQSVIHEDGIYEYVDNEENENYKEVEVNEAGENKKTKKLDEGL